MTTSKCGPTGRARRLVRLALVWLGLFFAVTTLQAAPTLATFNVHLEKTKADGKSWRGSGPIMIMLPGGLGPNSEVKNAPSPILCVVTADGDYGCPGAKRDQAGHMRSPCKLSFECEFEDIELPEGELFGIVVISPGIVFINLVDAVIFTRVEKLNTRDERYKSLNEAMHRIVERLAPSGSRDEFERRDRPFQLFGMERCKGASCQLRQSSLQMDLQ